MRDLVCVAHTQPEAPGCCYREGRLSSRCGADLVITSMRVLAGAGRNFTCITNDAIRTRAVQSRRCYDQLKSYRRNATGVFVPLSTKGDTEARRPCPSSSRVSLRQFSSLAAQTGPYTITALHAQHAGVRKPLRYYTIQSRKSTIQGLGKAHRPLTLPGYIQASTFEAGSRLCKLLPEDLGNPKMQHHL